MARAINRLRDITVRRVTKPGLYPDGAGLYLRVGPTGAKAWVFRYRQNGRRHDVGLGPLHTVSLAAARQRAQRCREQQLDGVDPDYLWRINAKARRPDLAIILDADPLVVAERLRSKGPHNRLQRLPAALAV